MKNNYTILTLEPSADYELLDSGDGEKLERFGATTLRRPDPQALWKKRLPEADWKKAHGSFTREERQGEWKLAKDMPDRWNISLEGLKFWIKPTAFKHTGIFPEQAGNWSWVKEVISGAPKSAAGEPVEVLNLFAYTGGATLACASACAKVVHVDSSKAAITWARDNAELSGLAEKPVRWILEDARVFAGREVTRGRKYDGIILDPPSFGHGPDNEIWKIEDHFLPLIDTCMSLLSDKPLFFIINGYSAGYSALAYENNLKALAAKHGGTIETGELTIRESGKDGRLLPCGIFARWKR